MTTLHIGHAPRLPRRERIARVLTQLGRYVLAWGLVGWACFWLVDIHLFVPGMVLAAMVGSPWRPKRPARPVRRVSARAVHSGLALRGALAGRAGSGPPFPGQGPSQLNQTSWTGA